MSDPLSVVTLCNLALSRIGVPQIITSLSDSSASAVQCNLWYGQCRDHLLREFPWPWAQGFVDLAQVNATDERANAQWLFSYRYPADCLYARKVAYTTTQNPDAVPQTPVTTLFPFTGPEVWRREDGDPLPQPFMVGHDTDGRLIFTDCPNAALWYTVAVTDPTQFSPDFTSLLSWKLATEISYSLAVSDARRKTAMEMFELERQRTRAMALNEGQGDQPQIIMQSEVARARFGG